MPSQYIRVRGSPVLYNNELINIGEFAFEANAIPEPTRNLPSL